MNGTRIVWRSISIPERDPALLENMSAVVGSSTLRVDRFSGYYFSGDIGNLARYRRPVPILFLTFLNFFWTKDSSLVWVKSKI